MYKFKSPATGDLIMLEPNGRQILTILGRSDADSQAKGILLPEDMPQAIAALQAAIQADEDNKARLIKEALDKGEAAPRFEGIALRHRALPLIEMIQRCQKAKKEIVWGV